MTKRKHTPLTKLKRLRKELRITQSMVASFLGVTPQFYSLIERGENVLSYKNALKLAIFFNTSTDELFKEDFVEDDSRLSELKKRGY